jgi:Dolichyl-phosphate-mannose-protein mannosyltransferase
MKALLTRRGVIAFWLAAATLLGLARYFASPTLSLDEARSVEMAQELAAGYTVRQPPLYDQLSWLLAQAFGPGPASQLTLHFAFVALIGLFTFLAVERATKSERFAAAASLSLTLHPYFGWSFHHWGTHTLALCVAALWTFVALVDLADRPGFRRAVILGLALGMGLTSKFSFPLFVAALLIAGTGLPKIRRILSSRWMLVATLVALALCAPYLAWLATVKGDVVGMARGHMIPGSQSHWVLAATGLGRLGWSMLDFAGPWLAVLALLMPAVFDPRVRRERPVTAAEHLAGRTTVVAIALAVAGIVATGATTLVGRYMPPLLILLPAVVFGRAAGIESTSAKLPRMAGAAIIAILLVVVWRAALPTAEAMMGQAAQHGPPSLSSARQ